jgi:hypothetical protein
MANGKKGVGKAFLVTAGRSPRDCIVVRLNGPSPINESKTDLGAEEGS